MNLNQPMQKVCEHYFASQIGKPVCVRVCMTCGAVDWKDLKREVEKAQAKVLFEAADDLYSDNRPTRLSIATWLRQRGERLAAGKPWKVFRGNDLIFEASTAEEVILWVKDNGGTGCTFEKRDE